MTKQECLEYIIKCFENLNNNIGEQLNEYHWREFCGIIEQMKICFPEYNLEKYQNSLFENLPNRNDVNKIKEW